MNLSEIKIWRIPISFWLLAVIMSYAPVLAHMMWPFIDYSDVYYSIQLASGVLEWFRGLAESSNWLVSTVAQIAYVGASGITAIFMLLEGIVTGFAPLWKAMGLDVQLGDSPVTVANLFQGFVYLTYIWTLYMSRKGGVEP